VSASASYVDCATRTWEPPTYGMWPRLKTNTTSVCRTSQRINSFRLTVECSRTELCRPVPNPYSLKTISHTLRGRGRRKWLRLLPGLEKVSKQFSPCNHWTSKAFKSFRSFTSKSGFGLRIHAQSVSVGVRRSLPSPNEYALGPRLVVSRFATEIQLQERPLSCSRSIPIKEFEQTSK